MGWILLCPADMGKSQSHLHSYWLLAGLTWLLGKVADAAFTEQCVCSPPVLGWISAGYSAPKDGICNLFKYYIQWCTETTGVWQGRVEIWVVTQSGSMLD